MLKNYFRIALRSYGKNYLYTLINIIGMAVGLSGVIITFLLFDYENGFDKMHINTENTFRVNCRRIIEGEEEKRGTVPSALGPEAIAELEGIEEFTRYARTQSFLVQHDNIIHRQRVNFADVNFFDHFTFNLISGDQSAFRDKSNVIISEQFAQKYFGDEEAVGKQLTFRKNDEIVAQFQVGGVVEKIPLNSSFRFDIITQYENLLDLFVEEEHSWSSNIRSVLYLRLGQYSKAAHVQQQLQKYVAINNEIQDSWKINDFYLTHFSKQKDERRFVHGYVTMGGLPISAIYGSFIMNALILLIACFNFANTSLAYANKRLKEIGIRRTFGGVRWQVIRQFFAENFVLCLLALLLSIEVANTWVGWMNKQWPIEIDMYYFDNWTITVNLMVLLVLVSVAAGAYPAFYLSRFLPTEILKGKIKLKGNNNFTRILLTWQFGFSIMAIFSGIVLTQNARFQKTIDWGFDKENVLVVPLQGEGNYETYKNELRKIATINSISGTLHSIGYGTSSTDIEIEGINHHTEFLEVGDNYLQTVGCQLIEGRNFLKNSTNDIRESLIVNEQFVETFDLEDPLNQSITIDSEQYYIVGIIKDFMPYGLFEPIEPTIMKLVPEAKYQQLAIRAKNQELPDILQKSESSWKELFPNKPFEGYFMEDVAYESMNTNRGILVQFGIMSLFALFLSVTGLYSIVSLTVNKRIKEIGIRKVLGASIRHVMQLLNFEFGVIILISIVLGSVGGYYFMDRFLSDIFTYYLDIGPTSFLIASAIVLLLTAFTSGIKIYRVAQRNPTESLRYE